MSLNLLFAIVAFILFLLAAFGVPSSRVSLGWMGAAVLTLTLIV